MKGRAEACSTYVFPRILYRLQIPPISKKWLVQFGNLLFYLTLWGGKGERVRRGTVIQRLSNGGLGMPSLKCHCDAERLAFLGRALTAESETPLGHKVGALFPKLDTDESAEQGCLPKESDFYRG